MSNVQVSTSVSLVKEKATKVTKFINSAELEQPGSSARAAQGAPAAPAGGEYGSPEETMPPRKVEAPMPRMQARELVVLLPRFFEVGLPLVFGPKRIFA